MLSHYLKLAGKILLRRKFFTFISLFGVSASLLVLMVVVALLDHVFAPHPPEIRSDRTLGIYRVTLRRPDWLSSSPAGYAFLERYVKPMEALPEVEKITLLRSPGEVVSYQDGKRTEVFLKRTDGAFWEVLRFDFVEGRPFTMDDEKNARFVAVINETTRRRFFKEGAALGRTLELGGQRFRVIGVVRDVPILRRAAFSDVWVPLSTEKTTSYRREWTGDFTALLLARSAADFPGIKRDFQARLREAASQFPDPSDYTPQPRRGDMEIESGADTAFEGMAREMLGGFTREDHAEKLLGILLLLMSLFLVLPSLNLININLSRILERSSEIGVRKAFGASSWILTGQFVVENVVLTLLGGLIALALATPVLAAINASDLLPYARLTLNYRIFFQGLAIALFFGLLSGVYPAWRMSRFHPIRALKGGAL